MRSITLALTASALYLLSLAGAAAEQALGPPQGSVVLTVTGELEKTNGDGVALFDLETLESLPQTTLVTSTPWTAGPVTFEGVLMRDLLEALGAADHSIEVVALNDFKSALPAGDFEAYDVLLAIKADGAYMRVRDKGPLWVIYPMDQHPELRNAETETKMVWQVARINVQ